MAGCSAFEGRPRPARREVTIPRPSEIDDASQATLRQDTRALRRALGRAERSEADCALALDQIANALDAVLSVVDQGIAIVDPTGRVALINDRFAAVMGMEAGAVATGAPLADLAAACGRHCAIAADHPLWVFPARIDARPLDVVRDDGAVIQLFARAVAGGGLVIACRDHTERVLYEEAMRGAAGDALLTIMNDVIDYSKLETGALRLDDIEFDLAYVVTKVVERLSARAQTRGMVFSARFAAAVPAMLRGDPGRLRELLVNLGNTALAYADHGQAALLVEPRPEAGGQVRLRFDLVVDDAALPPVALDSIRAVFDGATGLDPTVSPGILGPTICRRLAEAMGGSIGMAHVPGTEVRFWVELPYRVPAAKVRSSVATDAAVDVGPVLLVGAPNQGQGRWRRLAGDAKVHLDSAATVSECLALVHAARHDGRPYPVVIVSQDLPAPAVMELAAELRVRGELETTALVFSANSGARGDSQRLHRLGFAAYLTEPIQADVLRRCIATLGARRSGQPAETIITQHSLYEQGSAPQVQRAV